MSEIKVPVTLLNLLSDVNASEIKSHIYDDERLKSWLYSWREAVKMNYTIFITRRLTILSKLQINIADITQENARILRATIF